MSFRTVCGGGATIPGAALLRLRLLSGGTVKTLGTRTSTSGDARVCRRWSSRVFPDGTSAFRCVIGGAKETGSGQQLGLCQLGLALLLVLDRRSSA
jgi:hypothetical protein